MIFYIKERFKKRWNRLDSLTKNQYGRWLIYSCFISIGLWGIFAVGFWYTEGTSFEESIWQGWQTLTTVGYGNSPAESTWGRIITMIIGTMGIAQIGALFSAVFDYKAHLKEKKRLGLMDNPFSDGYVIFNFPGGSLLKQLISELRNVEKEIGICIVDDRIEELPVDIQQIPNVHFIKGDGLSKETYERAKICDNKAVIVYPVNKDDRQSDASTKTIVDLVDRFTTEKTRIIHMLVDSNNAWMFDKNKSTAIYANLDTLAVVQECQDPYSAPIIEQLLSNTAGANPMTVKPSRQVGWTWGELEQKILDVKQTYGINCNLFALIENGNYSTCPPSETVITDDSLISILGPADFKWTDLERHL
ncbi:potassium channel family protein [Sediminitomix flava]|uniref:Ion channel n=1 Tax=Sediminitomix flava TaxID=379075 RepID=A0A315ZI07_SEDFL|nr:potassium channel family protein [Sediminitomix flava]PWJ44853.1 ion channel [Sediminitomix flava]